MRAGIVLGAVLEIHSMHSVDADQQDPLNASAVLTIVGIRRRSGKCRERKNERRYVLFSRQSKSLLDLKPNMLPLQLD
jgi:hypothetical protein